MIRMKNKAKMNMNQIEKIRCVPACGRRVPDLTSEYLNYLNKPIYYGNIIYLMTKSLFIVQ